MDKKKKKKKKQVMSSFSVQIESKDSCFIITAIVYLWTNSKLLMDFCSSSFLVAVDLILMEGCLFSFPFILCESAKIASNGSESAL